MIVLLGSTGYIGQAFHTELVQRGADFEGLSRSHLDYTNFTELLGYLHSKKPQFLINAAGYTGKPNVDACESARADTLQGNTLFPQTVAQACAVAGIPWGHDTSCCIYRGGHLKHNGIETIEKELMHPPFQSK